MPKIIRPFVVDEAHLTRLLKDARRGEGSTDILLQRDTAHRLVDYYTIIMREFQGATGGNADAGVGVGQLIRYSLSLHPELDALRGVLDEVEELRHKMAHSEQAGADPDLLRRLIREAPEVRQRFQQYARQEAERRSNLTRVTQLFRDAADAAEKAVTLDPDAKHAHALIARVRKVANANRDTIAADELQALLDLHLVHHVEPLFEELAFQDKRIYNLQEQVDDLEMRNDEMRSALDEAEHQNDLLIGSRSPGYDLSTNPRRP